MYRRSMIAWPDLRRVLAAPRVYDLFQRGMGTIRAYERLAAGYISTRPGDRVLDIGCGTGHAMNVLAREFPNSMFTGYDIAEDAIALAREEANELALSNSTFNVVDVTDIPDDPKFNLITAFDAIHDQKAPDAVLRSANRALASDGTFLMIDFKFSSRVEENVGNPFAPMYYGISLMHCMPVSLAVGGQGLGTVWGEQTARRMLAEAGFGNVVVLDTPRPQTYMFVASHSRAVSALSLFC